jgi:stress-induced-phosphoprotein 1
MLTPKKNNKTFRDIMSNDILKADEMKAKGNDLYKARNFLEALDAYDAAIELNPNESTYYNNKAAVLIEMGKLDECEILLKNVIGRRYEINSACPGGASYEKCAKLYNRLASVYMKQGKYELAIECYNKSLTEDNNKTTRNLLRDAQSAQEKAEKEAYINPAIADEHREKGNAFFKEAKYAEAKAQYDEAIKRNPSDAKLYSNRAATLTKLVAYPDALRDLDECLKLDPTFVKAYSRKGTVHFLMKDYNKALESYSAGLALDPENVECKNGKNQVIAKINETSSSSDVDQDQIRRAMADPEIQQIMADPQIQMILQSMQENPAAGMEALKDPKVANAIQKLIGAGILRVGGR